MTLIGQFPPRRRTLAPTLLLRVIVTTAIAWSASARPGNVLAVQEDDARNAPTDAADQTSEGLWPSPNLMRLMLARWTEEAAHQYDLDDDQKAKVREKTIERWSRFLDENRAELQPLANEFVEMRMELEPPSKERVAEWASRAGPAFAKVRKQLDDGADEFRKVLRPMQRAKFEVDAMQMKIGLNFAEQRIRQWQSGEYDRDDFWEPLPADRESRRAKRRREREERDATAGTARTDQSRQSPTDQIAVELDSWERYVSEFIRAHDLDAGQRTSVLSFLSELRERAIAHRDRYRNDIARLEERIAAPEKSARELEEIEQQLHRLYGPIDDMFRELQTRVAQVPTVEQRAAANRSAADPAQASDSAGSAAGKTPARQPRKQTPSPEQPSDPSDENDDSPPER